MYYKINNMIKIYSLQKEKYISKTKQKKETETKSI